MHVVLAVLPLCFLDFAAVRHRALLLVVLPVLSLALLAAVVALLAHALELAPGGTAVFAELWVVEEVRHVLGQGGDGGGDAGDARERGCCELVCAAERDQRADVLGLWRPREPTRDDCPSLLLGSLSWRGQSVQTLQGDA